MLDGTYGFSAPVLGLIPKLSAERAAVLFFATVLMPSAGEHFEDRPTSVLRAPSTPAQGGNP